MRIPLCQEIYHPDAVALTAEAFKDICASTFEPTADGVTVTLTPLTDQPNATKEFLNYALALSAQHELA